MPDLDRPVPRQAARRARPSDLAQVPCSWTGTLVTDRMIDQVMALGADVRAWPEDTWGFLARTAGDSSEDYRDDCRECALLHAVACGRGPIIASATRTLRSDLPAAVTPAAHQALSDAVLAILLADTLPTLTYAILTRPVHVAGAQERRPLAGPSHGMTVESCGPAVQKSD